jgi:hypothetical protein
MRRNQLALNYSVPAQRLWRSCILEGEAGQSAYRPCAVQVVGQRRWIYPYPEYGPSYCGLSGLWFVVLRALKRAVSYCGLKRAVAVWLDRMKKSPKKRLVGVFPHLCCPHYIYDEYIIDISTIVYDVMFSYYVNYVIMFMVLHEYFG